MKRRDVQHLELPQLRDKEQSVPFPHMEFGAGFPPFTRGGHTTMYLTKPWTIRQYAGFSSAEESNYFYQQNLAKGQTGLSLAFDLATHRGYDSDHDRVIGDVGKTGVAIDSVEDMKILFQDIPLDKISVSMTINGAVLPILAFYIVAAEEQGVNQNLLAGTLQNDILKEFMVRNTYIYPPAPSMRIVGDIFEYTSKFMPKFNPISISGYHMQEAGATIEQELAYTLANGLEYIRTGLSKNIDIDFFAPRFSFFWGIGRDHFKEIAKLRAARTLWAKYVSAFNPKKEESLLLRAHCQTSGWSLTEQLPYNNITRTTIEGLSAVFGGTQSLHTNSFDEAIALPSEHAAKIARNTQLCMQNEMQLTQPVDPWAGSIHMEQLTHDLCVKATAIIDEIETLGGMTLAIEKGIPIAEIEKSALRKQARIESKKDLIIGLNHAVSAPKRNINHREIDTEKVRDEQIIKLNQLKANRNTQEVESALAEITQAAKNNSENLLKVVVHAARKRATLGEISLALETVFGRHQKSLTLSEGIYESEMKTDTSYLQAKEKVAEFYAKHNRSPKILLAKIGQDGHDRGAKIVASSYADMGFEVIPSPLFLTPNECAKMAVEHKVDCIGVSSLAGGHKTLVPQIITFLNHYNCPHIAVVVGGIIPEEDYDYLIQHQIKHVFGPGYPIAASAIKTIESIL